MKWHDEKKLFQCETCKINFTEKGTLRKHFASFHEGREQLKRENSVVKKVFYCVYCNKSFVGALRAHIKTVHEGQKP